ncbi:YjdJ family protein [Bacillus manliponensis]|uniref:YjdJ family protein n=1 Tax=Bacillus manliponensis TaxID=574376 RepID=UPI0035161AC9
MRTRYITQYGICLMFFIISTIMSWYEGSNLRENSFEWKYTAKFTNYFKGPVTEPSDIMQIDFFIYAAKFHPIPVWMMIASAAYIFLLSLYLVVKKMRNIAYEEA